MTDAAFTPDSIREVFGFGSHWLSTRPGERIHYLDEGDPAGTPVIFIHGSGVGVTSAANFYLNIRAAVGTGFRALGPDLYGYGWTDKPPEVSADIFVQTEQIVRFMDGLGLPKAYLVGNSLGSRIAVRVAMENPERILGCVLIGAGGAIWPGGARFAPTYTTQEAPKAMDRAAVIKGLSKLIEDPDKLSEGLIDYRMRMAMRPGEAERYYETTGNRASSAGATVLDVEQARKCPVPMLILYGREDRVGPPENALACAEAFPNADLVVFGHCGHWTMLERADDFNAMMLRFLTGYDRRIVSSPIRTRDMKAGDLAED